MKQETEFDRVQRPIEIAIYLQSALLGLIFCETWYLSQEIGTTFYGFIVKNEKYVEALFIWLLVALVLVLHISTSNFKGHIEKLYESKRFDLLVLVVLGAAIPASVGGIWSIKYIKALARIEFLQLLTLVSIPIAIALLLSIKKLCTEQKGTPKSSFFINDQAKESTDEDLLDLKESAARFAERVLNGGASDSLVFGIDAPWGIGKSSFVNFCCEYWEDHTAERPVVYRFEPLRYVGTKNLTDKLVHELVSEIEKIKFVPTLRPLITKYFGLIREQGEFSFGGFKISLGSSRETVDETIENLAWVLSELNQKIIVVIDDLDRLDWKAIKRILFAVKRTFMLPNITYVLCYDTENIASLSKDMRKRELVHEFLEKFVNVKISLFLDPNILADYLSENFKIAIKNNLQLDPRTHDNIQRTVEALIDIYESNEYFYYQAFIGDIRKLKRLINTLVLFEIEKTDFENSDFDKSDLLHLLLIYINYPTVFRKIYSTEANGKSGFFSLESQYNGQGQSTYKNSTNYEKYVNTKAIKECRFLLDKLFDVVTRLPDQSTLKEGDLRSFACFNGVSRTSRNLERYLKLIVKLSKPDIRDSYQFYLKRTNEILSGTPIDEVMMEEPFDFSKGDFARDELLRVVANSADELNHETGTGVVLHLLQHIPKYSVLEAEDVGAGSRSRLIYSLLKILDSVIWGTSSRGKSSRQNESVTEIANWIFGEKMHAEEGIIVTLGEASRGPLGLYDLMLFRLYCSADRGGSLFNLSTALSRHCSPDAPTAGVTTEIAKVGMREISQHVFQLFKSAYVTPRLNFFDAVDDLSLNDLAGETAEYVRKQNQRGCVSDEQLSYLIAIGKVKVLQFVIYQLGNAKIESGIGCGFYDEQGDNNEHGIAVQMNDYLFDVCFNAAIAERNYEHFLNYLLLNLSHTFTSDRGGNYRPFPEELTKVLIRERLKGYWSANKEQLMNYRIRHIDRKISASNYVATYDEDLLATFEVLDSL